MMTDTARATKVNRIPAAATQTKKMLQTFLRLSESATVPHIV